MEVRDKRERLEEEREEIIEGDETRRVKQGE